MEKADFEKMAQELDKMKSELLSLTGRLEALGGRAETIVKQNKRGMAVRDGDFSADFDALSGEMCGFSKKSSAFWQEAGTLLRGLTGAGIAPDSGLSARSFANRARAMNTAMEEFSSVFKYVKRQCAPLNRQEINWWPLEVCVADIEKASGRILFVSREISKLTDEAKRSRDEEI
jgi:hypothetical protein